MNAHPTLRIRTELGKLQTPPSGLERFLRRGDGEILLLLGLGPDPDDLRSLIGDASAFYVECPDFEAQMPGDWAAKIPQQWRRLQPSQLSDDLLRRALSYGYTHAVRLFPSFWGPIMAKAQAAVVCPASNDGLALLPGTERDLLLPEITEALNESGFSVQRIDPENVGATLPTLLREDGLGLFLSVNGRGLDPYGEVHHLLRACGVRVAIWLVDNPFHILSGFKSPFWREAALLVTDESFVQPLKEHGAERVLHLPLAVGSAFAQRGESPPGERDEDVVFIGRRSFPKKRGFFAGLHTPDEVNRQSEAEMRIGLRPDFHVQRRRLDIDSLWPESDVRRAGLAADEAGARWKTMCLRAAASAFPVSLYGDEGWREVVPEAHRVEGPVDYYLRAPDLYARSRCVFNVSGLLLPAGLNQRHFDVWAAGGCLVTDANPGLSLFPKELTEPVVFRCADEAPGAIKRLLSADFLRADLARAWRDYLLQEHTYRRRLQTALAWLDCVYGAEGA